MEEISRQKLNQILAEATQLARDKAKASGTSLIYEENGKMIREYADGKKMQVIYDVHRNRTVSKRVGLF